MATIPSTGKDRDWVAVLRRTMSAAWWGNDVTGIDTAPVALNGESLLAVNAAGTGTVELIKADSSNNVVINGQTIVPFLRTVTFRTLPVGTATARRFWVSDGNYTIVAIQEIHSTAEVTAASMGANIQKVSPAGVNQGLLAATINLKATANTLQTASLITTPSVMSLQTGDTLQWTTSAVGTELAGVVVSIILSPGGRGSQATFYCTNTGATDACIFVATRPMTISRIDWVHGTAASSACNVQVTLDTGTAAPGTGTDILSNNSNAGFDCTASAGVPQNGTLVAAATRMNPGDRLSLDFSGTTTGLTNGVAVVTFAPSEDRKEVTFYGQANSTHVDNVFFIADRAYQIEAASAVWSTPATAGANCQLVVDSGTQAPGAGLDLLSNDTNAGFQIDGTANTVEVGTFIAAGRNFLQTGDRLSLDYTVTTSIVGMVCTVTLKAA
jgi:hypothetical protein